MPSISNCNIRVMLIDAHQIVLSGLKHIIDDERPTMGVVAMATECAPAIALAESTMPDVVVLDVALATQNAAGVVPNLINGRSARVLLLSGSRDDKHELAILRGACGVVHKSDAPEVLIKAIRKVHDGQLWLDRASTGRLFVELSRRESAAPNDPFERKLASLTEREQQVVHILVKQPGADNKSLASSLHIGEHTLRNHLSRIYDKLDVPNRMELFVFAQQHVGRQSPLA